MNWPSIIEIRDDDEFALAQACALLDRLFLDIAREDLRWLNALGRSLEEMAEPPGLEGRRILRNAQRHLFKRLQG